MKSLLVILSALMLMAGSALAIMNNACKNGQHSWCASTASLRHHVRTGHS